MFKDGDDKTNYNISEQKEIWSNRQIWSESKGGHTWSDYFGTTDNLWNILLPKIQPYIKGDVLEIAPGYGRMTEYLLRLTDRLSVVDLSEPCIEECKKKFGSRIEKYSLGDGKSLDFPDGFFDFVFSYDSFVHMSDEVINCYLGEISRTLRSGGNAFIHHSCFSGGQNSCRKNRAGRLNMLPDRFRVLVENSGMFVISQEEFRVSTEALDTITIFHKP
jgi:SAM-dependent methyltransferase